MRNDPEPQDWLDARLAQSAVYLDDDGFTARVMARLPPRRAPRRWRTPILLLSALPAALAVRASAEVGQLFAAAANLQVLAALAALALVASAVGTGLFCARE